MRWILTVAMVVVCAACQLQTDGRQLAALPDQLQPPQAEAHPPCHDFAAPVTTGGKTEQASGQACRQPDGSWRVVQNIPGLPAQSYVLPPAGQPPASDAATAAAPNQPECSSYTAPVTVGGQTLQAVIEACPQPDGGWRITQNTPGLPAQVYEIPPPALSPYPYGYPYFGDYLYPDLYPYWAGWPWFFGIAPSIVVVQKFHHFNHGFAHGIGVGRGSARGFGRGFGGFGHGFAAGGGGGHR
jgi:hypothetical protein